MATITALRATPISIPLKTPYEWSGGHYGGFSRTIVEIEVSDGVVGLGESYSPDDAMVIRLATGWGGSL
jgi:glucarate dehydratase